MQVRSQFVLICFKMKWVWVWRWRLSFKTQLEDFFVPSNGHQNCLDKSLLLYRIFSSERYIVTGLWVNLIVNCIIHLMVCILGSILHFQGLYDDYWNISNGVLTIKGYSATFMFLDQPVIWQFISLNFHVVLNWSLCLPNRKTIP